MNFLLNENFFSQALSHVTPLRDYFLRESNYSKVKRPPGDSSYLLVTRFGELMRKLWNQRNFKAHVSPHEMLQAVVLWSKKKFQFTEQGMRYFSHLGKRRSIIILNISQIMYFLR